MDGDHNTRFYHTRAVQRRRRKLIQLLKDVDGNWTEDGDTIKEMFKKIYHSLYTTDVDTAKWIPKYGY